jgi:hypothetical protein
MKLGVTDFTQELNELVDEIKNYTWRLEDVWLENKKDNLF